MTYVKLAAPQLDTEIHATNLHLVAGAFNDTPLADKAARIEEWNDGIATHRAFVEELSRTGLPVVGGGDYNRQLKRHKSLGTRCARQARHLCRRQDRHRSAVVHQRRRLGWGVRSTGSTPGAMRPARAEQRSRRAASRRRPAVGGGGEEGLEGQRLSPAASGSVRRRIRPPAAPARPARTIRDRTKFGDGNPKMVDWKTRAALTEAERRLGYPLTIVQGSYNRGGRLRLGRHPRSAAVSSTCSPGTGRTRCG